ncbi:MAG: hypothetical protein M2R46_00272 [Verrucomicrobia subdivision 3 bacterium]|nr:hypothetical protein [Limisphaerales bacterium]
MPFSTTRNPLSGLGSARGKRSGRRPRASPSPALVPSVLRSGKFVHTLSPVFNAATFEAFLKVLLRRCSRNQKMVVILDNARYHHAKLLKPLLRAHRTHLNLLFLPPYSPQLAPIKRVWKLDAAAGASPSLLQQPGGVVGRCGGLLRPMAKTEPCSATVMRHYLSRYV